MAKIVSIPRRRRMPTTQGRIMIDVVRGVLRVRKWPKKRGTPKSESQRFWIDWFKQANLLAKYADPMSMARAKELTAHTGMYPRDIMLAAMRGRLYTWVDETGWRWYPVAAIDDISESLDVLAQTVGSILFRAADRWRSPSPGNVNDVLTLKGIPAAPAWVATGGGGGITQEVIAGTPIIPDGTQSQYDVDISQYASFQLDMYEIGFATASNPTLRFSIDGGLSFLAGNSDYRSGYVTPSADAWQWDTWVLGPRSAAASKVNCCYHFTNIKAGRLTWHVGASFGDGRMAIRYGHANFDGPCTHIRIMQNLGFNYNAGTIRMVGQR